MEFDLIHRHFKVPFAHLTQANRESVLKGIGDDCASLRVSLDHSLYVSTDTLVEGVHFFSEDTAHLVGWKSLACNLSDLAASGASPLGFMLNLSLPKADEVWLEHFSAGLHDLAVQFNCPLVGGDTTSAGANSVKTISITVLGQAPVAHCGFSRASANPGEEIWISGTPGLARLGLLLEYQKRGKPIQCGNEADMVDVEYLLDAMPAQLTEQAIKALQKPMPRIELGLKLRGMASACLDLSDGLSGDLGHVSKDSRLSAELNSDALLAMWRELWPGIDQHADSERLLRVLLNQTLQGGDDFELCWTADPSRHHEIQSLCKNLRCVGMTTRGEGVWLSKPGASPVRVGVQSYNHFGETNN